MKNQQVLEIFLDPDQNISMENLVPKRQELNELDQFFLSGRPFDFSSYQDCFCGFALFDSFAPHVNERNRDPFLKTVWDMFYDYRDKTGWHNWSGQFSPGRGALFAEGFLKYELCLAGTEPNFYSMTNYDTEWFDTTTAFLGAVKMFSNQTTYGLFIHRFSQNLAVINGRKPPTLGSIQEMIKKANQEAIIDFLASLVGDDAPDFDKILLREIPNGLLEICD